MVSTCYTQLSRFDQEGRHEPKGISHIRQFPVGRTRTAKCGAKLPSRQMSYSPLKFRSDQSHHSHDLSSSTPPSLYPSLTFTHTQYGMG